MDVCHSHQQHRWSSVRSGISADIRRYLTRSKEDIARGESFLRRLSAWLTPELQCLTLYRISHYFHARGWIRLGRLFSSINFLLYKVRLPASSCIGPGCRLSHPAGVVFEGTAGSNLTIFSYAVCISDYHIPDVAGGSPTIGNQVTLGGHAVLSGNILVGDNVRISPGAVVQVNIPDGVTVIADHLVPKLQRNNDDKQ